MTEWLVGEDAEAGVATTAAAVVVVVGAVVVGGAAATEAAGTQTDPPQASPAPQQAETPLKTHCGCEAPQVTEHNPTPLLLKQAAPPGQHPVPSGQGV